MDTVYNSRHEKDKLCVTLVKQLKDGIQINENLDILDNEKMGKSLAYVVVKIINSTQFTKNASLKK